MDYKGTTCLFVLLCAAPVCLAQSSDLTTVPFDLKTTRPIVKVFVNGEGPFKFVVDTGAPHTMVSRDLAKRLVLPRLGSVLVTAPNSTTVIELPQHRIKELRVSDLKFFGIKATAIMDDVFQQSLQADGVLSTKDFRGYLVTLDYRRSQIVVAPGSLPEADDKSVFDYEMHHGIPGITLDVMGQKTFFHLDSGSPLYIALPGAMLTTIEYEQAPQLVGRAGTVTGGFNLYYGKLAGYVTFGQFSIEKPTVEIMDQMPYGNLGYRFLRDYRVTFDYENERVRLEFWKDAAALVDGVRPFNP